MCYSFWQLGTIQIELTTLTTLISEGSAKQLVITILFAWKNLETITYLYRENFD